MKMLWKLTDNIKYEECEVSAFPRGFPTQYLIPLPSLELKGLNLSTPFFWDLQGEGKMHSWGAVEAEEKARGRRRRGLSVPPLGRKREERRGGE
uniref:Uncharacterized protein n=1 Tax=Anolis carolinensis TaxID=28377 RepID=A0A803T9W1_ANOCA